MRRRCYINIHISGGRDRYGTGGGGRRGIYHISGGRDPDCRAECEDGAIYIYLEEGTGMAPEEGEDGVYIYIYLEEGTGMTPEEGEDGVYIIY